MRINQLIIATLKAEAGEAELRELEAWRGESPENDRHYRELVAVWSLTEGGDAVEVGPPPAVGDIVAGAPSGPELLRLPPRPRNRSEARPRRTWRTRWTILAAAAAVAVIGIGTWSLVSERTGQAAAPLALGADEFVTGGAEKATVGLRDGTVVRLAPSSRLLLSGTTERREVALEGRAYFAVAPDEERPFRIRADAGTVQVLGTRFDLQTDGEDLRLIVVEGRVALAAGGRRTEVGAGEIGRVVGGTLIPTIRIPDALAMVDWLGDFLAFQSTPLAQAAREIERQYGVRVHIAGDELARRTVSAWFSDKSLEEVLRIVCAVVVARCTIDGDVVTMEPAPDGAGLQTALLADL